LRLQPSQLQAIHFHVCSNSPFSIKALNKIKFHVAPSSDVTAATAAGDRSKSTCNEFSARGPRMECRAESGNAWPGVTPAHSIGSRQLQGSLHVVFVPLALHHPSASHAHSDRATLHKRSPDARKTWSCPRPLCAFSWT